MVTITGNVYDITHTAAATNTFVRFRLRNYTGTLPRVLGTGALLPGITVGGEVSYDFTPAASTGLVTGTVYGNDAIDPANTYYAVEFYANGRCAYSADFLLTGSSFNFNTATPLIVPLTPAVGAVGVFGASGTTHSVGLVPDPGSVAGVTKFLREDSTWNDPSGISSGGVQYADTFSGADAGAKIIAAIAAAVTAEGKIVNARGLTGTQSSSAVIDIPANITLLLGHVSLTVPQITIAGGADGGAILGLGTTDRPFSSGATAVTKIIGSAANPVIMFDGSGASNGIQGWQLRNFMIDGASVATYGVYLDTVHNSTFDNVSVRNVTISAWFGGTSTTTTPLGTVFNTFIHLRGSDNPQCFVMDSNPGKTADFTQNSFFDTHFNFGVGASTGDAFDFVGADGNWFYGLVLYRDSGTGKTIRFRNATSTHFGGFNNVIWNFNASAGAEPICETATINAIYGYDLGNAQTYPTLQGTGKCVIQLTGPTDTVGTVLPNASYLTWWNSAGTGVTGVMNMDVSDILNFTASGSGHYRFYDTAGGNVTLDLDVNGYLTAKSYVDSLVGFKVNGSALSVDNLADGTTYKKFTAAGHTQLLLRNISDGNFVWNPGFEDGASFWQATTGVSIVTNATNAYTGNKYLQLSSATGVLMYHIDDAGTTKYWEVNPDDSLSFGGWIYRESGDGTCRIILETFDKDKVSTGYPSSSNVTTSGSWQFVTGTYTVASGVKYVALACQFYGATGATVVRYDDVHLRLEVPVFIASGTTHAVGLVPDPGASSGTTKYLREDATWQTPPGTGGGTVNSVGLSTDAAWLTVGSSPVTDSGTITLNKTDGLTANYVLASPDGMTGKVTLRALVAADIPNLSATKITSGAVALARGGTAADLSATGAATHVLAQAADHSISARALVSADIPNNAADTSGSSATCTGTAAKTNALNSATTVVNVSSATAPTAGQVLKATSGTAATWQSRTIGISYVIDGGGAVVGTGAYGQLNIPFACTVTGWVLTANQSGDAVVDIKRATYANFPGSLASIAGTDKPTLSTAQKNENLSISSWGSTAIAAGDQIQFYVDSAATVTRLNLTLVCTIP